MVAPKHPKDFSCDEVGMWLVAIGLGSKVELFDVAGVDGSMLVILSTDDFAELGLSGLQGKKLMTSLESAKAMAEGGGGGGGVDEATAKRLQELEDENFALRQQLAAYQQASAPPPEPAPEPAPAPAPAPPPPPVHHAPAPAPPPQRRQGAVTGHVVAGAAGGAARGAIKGAVVGAVLGDAGKGAAAGAAGGAVGGAMGGLGARRRARMRARR
ncbi:expressed unknown protein [Seminavis robusta]|uniref:SAM domain-containing protein n=1 Tax=Seminavis robusta TaxID=568900 RepID=A0A9N8EQI8_9STRA|nr:expressed unknown protein [Seminavis robusta]|eukprot:Sro1607_g285610.1 n/a (213) ;mRNA; r:16078-16838